MQYSQEHLKTMVYAKFGGQTECIMGDLKIENSYFLKLKFVHFLEWEGKAPWIQYKQYWQEGT